MPGFHPFTLKSNLYFSLLVVHKFRFLEGLFSGSLDNQLLGAFTVEARVTEERAEKKKEAILFYFLFCLSLKK